MDSFESESEEITVTVRYSKKDYEEMKSWLTNIYGVVVICSAYSVIFFFGLIGNLLIGCNMFRDKSTRTVINVLLLNITVANFLLCLIIIPMATAKLFVIDWVFGRFMCHLEPCILPSVTFVSMLTLALTAASRYLTIVHPLKQKTNTKTVIVIMVITWLVSIAASSPLGMLMNYREYTAIQNNPRFLCHLHFPSIDIYCITTLVLLIVIPLLVVVSFCIALSIKISRMSTPDNVTRMADKRRTSRLLVAMAIVCCICLVPNNIYILVWSFNWQVVHWKIWFIIVKVFDVLAFSWACFTPLFYMWLNKITIKQLCLIGVCCKRYSPQSNSVDNIDTSGPSYQVLKGDGKANVVTYSAHCDTVNLVSIDNIN